MSATTSGPTCCPAGRGPNCPDCRLIDLECTWLQAIMGANREGELSEAGTDAFLSLCSETFRALERLLGGARHQRLATVPPSVN